MLNTTKKEQRRKKIMIKEWPKQKSQIEELKAEVKNRQEALQEQEEKLKKIEKELWNSWYSIW